MSTLQVHEVPRYLVTYYFWVCLDKMNICIIDSVKQIALPNQGGPHPNHKRLTNRKCSLSLPDCFHARTLVFCHWTHTQNETYTSGLPASWVFELRLEIRQLLSQISNLLPGDLRLLSLMERVNEITVLPFDISVSLEQIFSFWFCRFYFFPICIV